MRDIAILLTMYAICATGSNAQITADLMYGVDRNVDSGQPRLDGWVGATVEWTVSPGFGLGIGTDHQFRDALPTPSSHLGFALYVSSSYELPMDRVSPFVRGGIGAGRAPCEADTCGDGAYFRGSAGLRVRLVGEIRLLGEIGVSRVSRPFGGAGVSMRF